MLAARHTCAARRLPACATYLAASSIRSIGTCDSCAARSNVNGGVERRQCAQEVVEGVAASEGREDARALLLGQ
jgi:hypothetical protein